MSRRIICEVSMVKISKKYDIAETNYIFCVGFSGSFSFVKDYCALTFTNQYMNERGYHCMKMKYQSREACGAMPNKSNRSHQQLDLDKINILIMI